MVDPIGWKATRPIRVTTAAPAMPVQTASAKTQTAAAAETSAAKALAAAGPPVDLERVTRIKKAIADGRFPILPSTIADRLLALKLDWNPNEQA